MSDCKLKHDIQKQLEKPFVNVVPMQKNKILSLQRNDSKQDFRRGCLKFATGRWTLLGASNFKDDCRLLFAFPKATSFEISYQKIFRELSHQFSAEMTQMVELKCKEILERPVIVGPGFYSKMLLVKKADWGLRPICDLKALNR